MVETRLHRQARAGSDARRQPAPETRRRAGWRPHWRRFGSPSGRRVRQVRLGNEHHGQPSGLPEVRPTVRCGDLTRRTIGIAECYPPSKSRLVRCCERLNAHGGWPSTCSGPPATTHARYFNCHVLRSGLPSSASLRTGGAYSSTRAPMFTSARTISTRAPTPREEPMTESRLVQCPACGATNRVPMDEMKPGRQPVCGRCNRAGRQCHPAPCP